MPSLGIFVCVEARGYAGSGLRFLRVLVCHGGGGSGGSGAAKLRGESVRAGLRKRSFGSVICRTIAIAPIRASASNYA